MAKIDWDYARKADLWTLEEFCGFIHPGDPSAQAKLDALARRAIGAGEMVPRKVVRRPVRFLAGTPDWQKYIIYLTPAEALAWARAKGFTIPPQLADIPRPAGGTPDKTQPSAAPDNETIAKRKAPDIFIAALIRLLVEISKRATEKGMPFDTDGMPGRKADFMALAIKFNDELDQKTPRTFDDYLAGLLRFKQGARETTFYKDLFPEFFAPRRPVP